VRNPVLPTALEQFVHAVERGLEDVGSERSLLDEVGRAMRALVSVDGWLDPTYAEPHPLHYQQYLLYPGQRTPIHDHTVWGVIGMLRGAELTQRYRIRSDGVPIAVGPETRLLPGAVEFVSPSLGDVHAVSNALDDGVSISIHAYGADIGKVRRHVFAPEGGVPKTFVSGYANVE
jgi:predicted metal-dependent enzyme (double-stranded beta helix superfamily)